MKESVLIEGSMAEVDRMSGIGVWSSLPREGAWTRAKTFDTNILELFLFLPSFLFLTLVYTKSDSKFLFGN